MIALTVDNIKDFMRLLFKSSIFDKYGVHQALCTTFTTFEITGDLNREFFDETDAPERKYCTWEEIRPFVYHVIKGSKLPKYMKVVLSAPTDMLESISDNASALFINIIYDGGTLTLISGYAIKKFSMNKTHEFLWDEYVTDLMKKSGLSVSTQT